MKYFWCIILLGTALSREVAGHFRCCFLLEDDPHSVWVWGYSFGVCYHPVFSTPKYCLHCLSVGGKRLHASLSSWNTVWGRTHRPHYYSSLFPLRQNGLVVRRSQVNWLVWNLYPASLQPNDLGQLALSSLSVIFLFWNLRIKMILQCLWLELIWI